MKGWNNERIDKRIKGWKNERKKNCKNERIKVRKEAERMKERLKWWIERKDKKMKEDEKMNGWMNKWRMSPVFPLVPECLTGPQLDRGGRIHSQDR